MADETRALGGHARVRVTSDVVGLVAKTGDDALAVGRLVMDAVHHPKLAKSAVASARVIASRVVDAVSAAHGRANATDIARLREIAGAFFVHAQTSSKALRSDGQSMFDAATALYTLALRQELRTDLRELDSLTNGFVSALIATVPADAFRADGSLSHNGEPASCLACGFYVAGTDNFAPVSGSNLHDAIRSIVFHLNNLPGAVLQVERLGAFRWVPEMRRLAPIQHSEA